MKNITFLLLISCSLCFAQKSRVQIKGTINSVTEEPMEGITIFNLNSLEGADY